MLHKRMSEADRRKLVGKKVSFTATRDGVPVERYGVIEKVTPLLVWISSHLYTHAELRGLQEVQT